MLEEHQVASWEAYRLVYEMIKEAHGEDSRVTHTDGPRYVSIQIDKPASWFLRVYPAEKYIIARISPQKALGFGDPAKPSAVGPQTCRIDITGIDGLRAHRQSILAAYHAVTVATGLLDPSEIPGEDGQQTQPPTV